MPLEVQHELLRFSRLDTTQLLTDPSQQLAYGYVAGNALAWNDQMGLGLFKKRTAEEKAQRASGRADRKANRKASRKKFFDGVRKNFSKAVNTVTKVGRNVVKTAARAGFEAGIAYGAQFNTKIGFAVGMALATAGSIGKVLGINDNLPSFGFGNRALQIKSLPFIASPMSLGNIHLYPPGRNPNDENKGMYFTPDNYTTGKEEGMHTIQAGILGAGYIPAHILTGVISTISKPSPEIIGEIDSWHHNNILELGPMKGQLLP